MQPIESKYMPYNLPIITNYMPIMPARPLYRFLICGLFAGSLAACGQLSKSQIKDEGFISEHDMELSYSHRSDLHITGSNKGEEFVVPQNTLKNLHDAREKLTKASGKTFNYAIVDSDYHSHIVITQGDQEYIGFSLHFLDKFGDDQDVIAAAVAHDLAHIADGDTGDAQDQREIGFFVARQVVSAALSFVGSPIAGYGGSLAITGMEHGVAVAEENKTNPIGLQWLVDAGYTPCGYVTMKKHADTNATLDNPAEFISTHPGVDDRAELAQQKMAEKTGKSCEAIVPSPAVAEPEPVNAKLKRQ